MIALFQKFIKQFHQSSTQELEEYIAVRHPTCAGDLDRIIQEYTYKKIGGWI